MTLSFSDWISAVVWRWLRWKGWLNMRSISMRIIILVYKLIVSRILNWSMDFGCNWQIKLHYSIEGLL